MSYELLFVVSALREWKKLDQPIRLAFKKKLAERLENPRIPAAALHGPSRDRYKIKLRDAGYRLVYEVSDQMVTVTVIAVGSRVDVYDIAKRR